MNTCWPVSTGSPVTGSGADPARPPRTDLRSSTMTSWPDRAISHAARSPASPAPMTTTRRFMEPAGSGEPGAQPGAAGDDELVGLRQPGRLAVQRPVELLLDPAQQRLIRFAHDLGAEQRLAELRVIHDDQLGPV